MSPQIYHVIHLLGLIGVFIGFGAILAGNTKAGMKWHGIGLLISLISGFGMVAKLHIPITSSKWLMVKMALWLVLGFLPVLVKKGVSPKTVVSIAALVGVTLAYLGYMKPF